MILLDPQDKLDASNCRQLINATKAACKQGYQEVAMEMGQVRLISNCGLLTLHVIASQLQKASLPPLQLLNLQPHIRQALSFSEFYSYVEPDTKRAGTISSRIKRDGTTLIQQR
jgi:anti-anti-sigma regulatory factor